MKKISRLSLTSISVLRMVLLLAPDERRSEGKGAVQEDRGSRLHRRRERQEDVKVHRERSQPRSGRKFYFNIETIWVYNTVENGR